MLRKLVNEFRREGFFTIQLTHEPNLTIWQVSMNDMEISFQRRDTAIHVECTPAEEAVVNQAWMEVISQMNELAKTISKPLLRRKDMAELVTKADSDRASESSQASRIVQHFVMLPSFKAYSKKEAIERLIEAVAEKYPKNIVDLDSVKKAVFNREESMPTGLDHGIAVPHGRTDGVNHIVGAVAIVDNSENENGIIPDYETIDHSKIQVIVLTLVPDTEQNPYLQIMAYITHALHSPSLKSQLLACKTAEDMQKFFRSVH